MKIERKQKSNGFVVIILDIIFIVVGLFLLITALLGNRDILSALKSLIPSIPK